ncbi:hemolysin D [Pluralibacter gergoviae]|uniref:HlyD family secretion protein n=1 Tax=Pluralibacter gergoviae TaxID=61647 RepID=UPI0005EC7127|nr:HlyD family secretion protein [Pluralibacter gergoviae]KJM61069.1 hemolysin D [Pluralibacter gergoviae]OUR02734.1 hemolysin D [Pluralibacter gergoviae]
MSLSKKNLIKLAAALALLAACALLAWWLLSGRYSESTDDAYVGGDVTAIASKVPGYIAAIGVKDNMRVSKGEVLLSLDDRDYRAAVDQARAEVATRLGALESVRASLAMQRPAIAAAAAAQQAAELEAQKIFGDSRRYQLLAKSAAISQQIKENTQLEYRRLRAQVVKAQADTQTEKQRLAVLAAEESRAQGKLDGARAKLAQAQLNLSYTVIKAPFDGIVGNRSARAGSWAAGGAHLLSLVPVSGLWIDANFKENQLAHMRPGMRAEVRADILRGNVFYGRVESLSPATGASFSLIPVENATGNFTKIVQRVPVRIVLDDDPQGQLLRPGLSVTVRVDEKP